MKKLPEIEFIPAKNIAPPELGSYTGIPTPEFNCPRLPDNLPEIDTTLSPYIQAEKKEFVYGDDLEEARRELGLTELIIDRMETLAMNCPWIQTSELTDIRFLTTKWREKDWTHLVQIMGCRSWSEVIQWFIDTPSVAEFYDDYIGKQAEYFFELRSGQSTLEEYRVKMAKPEQRWARFCLQDTPLSEMKYWHDTVNYEHEKEHGDQIKKVCRDMEGRLDGEPDIRLKSYALAKEKDSIHIVSTKTVSVANLYQLCKNDQSLIMEFLDRLIDEIATTKTFISSGDQKYL